MIILVSPLSAVSAPLVDNQELNSSAISFANDSFASAAVTSTAGQVTLALLPRRWLDSFPHPHRSLSPSRNLTSMMMMMVLILRDPHAVCKEGALPQQEGTLTTTTTTTFFLSLFSTVDCGTFSNHLSAHCRGHIPRDLGGRVDLVFAGSLHLSIITSQRVYSSVLTSGLVALNHFFCPFFGVLFRWLSRHAVTHCLCVTWCKVFLLLIVWSSRSGLPRSGAFGFSGYSVDVLLLYCVTDQWFTFCWCLHFGCFWWSRFVRFGACCSSGFWRAPA